MCVSTTTIGMTQDSALGVTQIDAKLELRRLLGRMRRLGINVKPLPPLHCITQPPFT